MQDRYAGDVGDFGKFGLLRHLCGVTAQDKHPSLKPGVIWYRVDDESHNADGCHICYLQNSPVNDRRFGACDKTLYDALKTMVFTDHDRTIAALQRANLLPNATYFPGVVRHGRIQVTCPRDDWFKSAQEQTAGCELVFVDPDNGIGCPDLPTTQRKSCKFVLRKEVQSLAERKPRTSVVIYQHMDQTKGTAEDKTRHQLEDLPNEPGCEPFAVLFRRSTVRAFLVLPNQEHRQVLLERTNALVQTWGKEEWKAGKARGHFTGPIFLK